MIKQDQFFKKEMLILALLQHHDYSDIQLHQLINEISPQQSELKLGVLFTSLYFLKKSHLISYHDGLYHIETAGLVRLETLKRQYSDTTTYISQILKKGELHD